MYTSDYLSTSKSTNATSCYIIILNPFESNILSPALNLQNLAAQTHSKLLLICCPSA